MSRGLICDGCGSAVKFDGNRGDESSTGEESAWIRLTADNVRDYHACTRECAKAVIDGEFGRVVEAEYQVIAEIARAIRQETATDEPGTQA